MTEDNRGAVFVTSILRGAGFQLDQPVGRESGEGVLFIRDLFLFDLIGKSQSY